MWMEKQINSRIGIYRGSFTMLSFDDSSQIVSIEEKPDGHQRDTTQRRLSFMWRTQKKSQSTSCHPLIKLLLTIEIMMMVVHTIRPEDIAVSQPQADQRAAHPILRPLSTRRRTPTRLLNSKDHCMRTTAPI